MKIGIDISQLAYQQTGVANYLRQLVSTMIASDTQNEYILFFSGLRRSLPHYSFLNASNVSIKSYRFSPKMLDFLWNTLHILPIEYFIGDVDVLITSDWTEPPTKKAKKITILYDLIVYTYPEETDAGIVSVQRKKLAWVKKESDAILCISESTKKDAIKLLGIDSDRLFVIYPGMRREY